MPNRKTKYVFITGGVCSSLGKGITAGSVGLLLEKQGYKVALMKMDPYINVDPGTMSPYQHGEVYVTDDGAETDLDLGHYWRFTHTPLSRVSSVSTGQIYKTVIERERQGQYLGKTIQVIPHITDEIKARIYLAGRQDDDIDIVVVEIGGTVGDIESLPFLEAIRQFVNEKKADATTIHLTYVPFLPAAEETKTKPTQHSVQMLREIGIQPDFIVCRSHKHLPSDVREKISLFCNVPVDHVLEEPDVENSIYEVPLQLKEQNMDALVLETLGLSYQEVSLKDWSKLLDAIQAEKKVLPLAICGKYLQHKDAYKSIYEALEHAAIHLGLTLDFHLIESDKVEEDPSLLEVMEMCGGVIVPGGFGERGWNGKILAAKKAREENIPYFGICLGLQVMVVEAARHLLELPEANSTEIDPSTPHPVVDLMESQKEVDQIGATMRLGKYPCHIAKTTKLYAAYQRELVYERHRHRFEVNNSYLEQLQDMGMVVSGTLEAGHLVEAIEIKEHPWMVGVQYHPEFLSRPLEPHPLFVAFLQAAVKR